MTNKTLVLPVDSHPYPNTVRTSHVLRIPGTQSGCGRWAVAGVPRGASGNKEKRDGTTERVPGPWAFAVQLGATMSDDGRGTGYEMARKLAEGTEHIASHGDIVEFDGCTYRVEVCKRGYVTLVAL